MAALATFVTSCQPAFYGSGVDAPATEGVTWKWTWLGVTDPAGAAVNFTGLTGTCKVLTAIGGSTVVTLTFTGASGGFSVSATAAATASLAAGASADGIRYCVWSCSVTDGTDTVELWSPVNSPFRIFKGA